VIFHAPLRSASGGARSLKPMVGRGPRDQSSGQKPRARLPEVLACRAALRFKRARRREAGRAGLPRLLLNRGLNPFLGGVLDECGSEHSKSSRGHFFLKNDPRSLFGFHLPRYVPNQFSVDVVYQVEASAYLLFSRIRFPLLKLHREIVTFGVGTPSTPHVRRCIGVCGIPADCDVWLSLPARGR
jgi:hypothetical protein